MKYYLAPMEGITTYVYRNAYHKYFSPMEKYFTPYLVPHTKKNFTTRELKEIGPEHNAGLFVVPQILSKDADETLMTIKKLQALGYGEVNLNLGCPSKTVAAKDRGAGFLAKPEELDRYLDVVVSGADAEGVAVSVKTRIGRDERSEFPRLLEIYNRYPLAELIIHPRTQKDFYGNLPDLSAFALAVRESPSPLCYNGDVFTAQDAARIRDEFPDLPAIMMGRGVIANPGLLGEIRARVERPSAPSGGGMDFVVLRAFHDEIYARYQADCSGKKPVLYKMKELWSYMKHMFPGSEKLIKRLNKAEDFASYERAVDALFSDRLPDADGSP